MMNATRGIDILKKSNSIFILLIMAFLSVSFFACQKPTLYQITFDSMGGTPVKPIVAKYHQDIDEPNEPAKNDIEFFDGWYTEQTYQSAYVFDTMPKSNLTLYAKWKDIELTDDPIHLIFWTHEKHERLALINDYVAEFEALYPQITIEVVSHFDSPLGVGSALSTTFDYPNLIQLEPNYMQSIHKSLMILDPYIQNKTWGLHDDMMIDDIILSFREEYQQFDVEKHYYGLPFSISAEVMLYNKTAFDAIEKEPPKTWQELMALAPDLNQYGTQFHDANQVIPAIYNQPGHAFITMIEQFDGEYIGYHMDIDKGEMLFHDDANALSALNFMKEMRDVLSFPGFSSSVIYGSEFKEQHTFLFLDSSSYIKWNTPPIDLDTNEPVFELGAAPIPYHEDMEAYQAVLQSGNGISINKNKSIQERLASWLFLKFVTNQENTARWSMITGNIPVRYRAIESQVYQDFLNHPTEEQKYYSLVANVNVKQLDDLFFPVAFKKAIFYYNDVNLAAEHIVIDGWSVSMALKWIEED